VRVAVAVATSATLAAADCNAAAIGPRIASAPATTTTRPAKEFTVDSVLDGFVRNVRQRPDGVAFRTYDGETWTWAEYAGRAGRFAAGLRDLGVSRGDRVVLMLRNRLEFHV